VTYDPWAVAQGMPELTVAVTRLPAGHAWWLPDVNGIALDDRLTQAERRAALAHELEHAVAGDTCLLGQGPDSERLHRRRERRTDERAARRLIDLDQLADALAWCLGVDELADQLHVDERTVRARIRCLTEAEKTYIERRMAAKGGPARLFGGTKDKPNFGVFGSVVWPGPTEPPACEHS
jgi:hypothetical protein